MKTNSTRRDRGFALIATAACAVAMLGMLGLAVDLGRLYVVKSEVQTYTDSAALAAALELDATQAGLDRARNVVAGNPNRWNFSTAAFSGTETAFSTDATGPWETSPGSAAGYRFVRVSASGTLKLYFMPAMITRDQSTVRALSVAGQVEKQDFREGVLPFSPTAHNNAPPDFGYVPGNIYTLRWGSNPMLNVNVCAGDNEPQWVAKAKEGSSDERGYIEETSASVIRTAIVDNYQSRPIGVGDPVFMTGGNKQTERDALRERIFQDTDPVSASYAAYKAADAGNSRRMVVVPINTGHPDNVVLGFGLFFLLPPDTYDQSGNRPFCAEYVGPYVQGSRHEGAGGPGAYVVRLVQ